jgi:hypothetical protein
VRRRPSDPEFTLFPFLSVLAAIMGTLILIITGMSRIALANPKQRVEVEAFDATKKSPIYVECRIEGLLVYPDDPTSGAPDVILRGMIGDPGGKWHELLTRLEHDSTRYILFLVRSDGVRTFDLARVSASGMGLDVGYEPLFGTGDVKFKAKGTR